MKPVLLWLKYNIITVFFFVVAVASFLSCINVIMRLDDRSSTSKRQHHEVGEQKPSMIIHDLALETFENKDSLALSVKIKNNYFLEQEGVVKSQDICCLLKKNGKDFGQLLSPDAYFYRKKKDIFFPHKVHGTLLDIAIEAQEVLYDSKRGIIVTKRPLHGSKKTFHLFSNNSLCDLKKKQLVFTQGITTTFILNCDNQQEQ